MGIDPITGTLLAVTALASVGGAVAQNEAADAQRDAARNQQRQAKLKAARERTSAIRAARLARGQTEVSGAASGVTRESSGLAGGLDSIQSQLFSNLGFSINMETLSDQASAELAQASREAGIASIFNSVAQISGQAAVFSAGGGFGQNTGGQTLEEFAKANPDTFLKG